MFLKLFVPGLEDNDGEVHHGHSEADEAEAEGDEESDQSLLLWKTRKAFGKSRILKNIHNNLDSAWFEYKNPRSW